MHAVCIALGADAAQLRVTGPGYRSDTWLLNDRGERTLHINYLMIEPSAQGQGLGTRLWATQAREARRLGSTAASLDAGRRDAVDATPSAPAMHGYAWWPKMVFDAPLSCARMDQPLPTSFAGARTVRDLLDLPGGSAWWREHGSSTKMQFDLTPGSTSWARLNATLRQRKQLGSHTVSRAREKRQTEPEDEWPIIGEVGDPMTEEEAEAAEEAIQALNVPPITDEELARMHEGLDRAERMQKRSVRLIRRQRAYEAKHD